MGHGSLRDQVDTLHSHRRPLYSDPELRTVEIRYQCDSCFTSLDMCLGGVEGITSNLIEWRVDGHRCGFELTRDRYSAAVRQSEHTLGYSRRIDFRTPQPQKLLT